MYNSYDDTAPTFYLKQYLYLLDFRVLRIEHNMNSMNKKMDLRHALLHHQKVLNFCICLQCTSSLYHINFIGNSCSLNVLFQNIGSCETEVFIRKPYPGMKVKCTVCDEISGMSLVEQ